MDKFRFFAYNADFDFDFDEWSMLAQNDPEAFDRKRKEVLWRVVEGNQDNRRLSGLQCRIDLERIRAHTPLKACLCLSDMMWDSFFELKDALNHVNAGNKTMPPLERTTTAKIIPFRKAPRGIDA